MAKRERPKNVVKMLQEKGLWDEKYGDRSTEIVLIGIHLDKEGVLKALNETLVNDEEFGKGQEEWDFYDDPFDFYAYEDEFDEEDEEEEDPEEQKAASSSSTHHGHSHGQDGLCHGSGNDEGDGHGHDEPEGPKICRIIVEV